METKIIKFSGERCPACKNMDKYIMGKFSNIITYDIGTLEGMTMASTHGVRSIPTLIVMEDDEETYRTTGFIKSEIDRIIYNIKK